LDARLGAKAIRRSNELPDELVILKILRQADVPIFGFVQSLQFEEIIARGKVVRSEDLLGQC
jgi:hypothetical protein